MIVSHQHRFIFWKPHKVASTSVLAALAHHCGPNDSVGGALDGEYTGERRNMAAFSHLPTAGNHATPKQIRSVCDFLWGKDIWLRYTRITIVRNPWDRAVSWWDYANRTLGKNLSFEQALANSERSYWFTPDGEPWAQITLRYESLNADYEKLCSDLSLPCQPLQHLRPGSARRHYSTYYDARSRDLVARHFDREIEHYHYSFETAEDVEN